MYFASMTLAEFSPILTILAAMLVGFYGLLKFVLGQAEKDRDAERADRKEFGMPLTELTESTVSLIITFTNRTGVYFK